MNLYIVQCVFLGIVFSNGVFAQAPATSQTAGTTNTVTGLYNCDRYNMICMGANSNCTAGVCNCEDGLEWFDCSVNTSQKTTGNCGCMNGGICVDKGSGVECACTEAFYGPRCATSRVKPSCFTDSVEIALVPYSTTGYPFEGSIYVLENENSNCTLQGNSSGVYSKKIMYDDCGGAESANDTNGDITKSFTIIAQYDPLFVTDTDQKFLIECTIKKSDSNVQWEETDLSSSKNQPNLKEQKVTGQVRPVTLSIRNAESDLPITGQQMIGTPLKLVFTFNGGNVYDSFRVEQVTAYNGLTGADARSFDFIIGSCVNPAAIKPGRKIITGFSGDPTREVSITFPLIRLPKSNQLAFRNLVKLCKGTGGCNTTVRPGIIVPFDTSASPLKQQMHRLPQSTSANIGDCSPATFKGFGRRRRSIDDFTLDEGDDVSKFEELDNKGVIVWIPGQKNMPSDVADFFGNKEDKSSPCFENVWFILCIVAFILAFSLGGALVAMLCVRRFNSKQEAVSGFDNKGYSAKF